MQPEDPREPADVTDRRFDAVVAALGHDDPRFSRRVSAPPARRISATGVALVVGMVLTVALGIVPLAVGLHGHSSALLAVGAVGLLVLPLTVPLAVRAVLRRARPLWR